MAMRAALVLPGVGARGLSILKAGSPAALEMERRDFKAQDRMMKLAGHALLSVRGRSAIELMARTV